MLFIFLSFYLFLFAPSAQAVGLYQGTQYYPEGLTACPASAKCINSYCPPGKTQVALAGCADPGEVCCQDKTMGPPPAGDCLGSCVPKDQCASFTSSISDPNKPGECADANLACCGILKSSPNAEAPAIPATTLPATVTVSYEGQQCKTPAGVSFPCPLGVGSAEGISSLVGRIIKWFLGLVGALFFGMFVWGGTLYLTAGASKRAEEGRKTLINACIGMAIVVFSYLLLDWVLNMIAAAIGA